MAKNNLTKAANIAVTAREIDFVTRFQLTWEALQNIMGISRPIRMQPGTVLKSKRASVVLQSGNVGEGESIPYSQASVVEIPYAEIALEKYKKGVSIEAIKKYGYDVAVERTDRAFLNEVQSGIMTRFYNFINGGELTNIETTFQMALATARGLVTEKWQRMNLTVTDVVGFVNTLDVYEYLGAAGITVQNQFGFNYIKDFMGYNTIFLVDSDKLARGKVIATPAENIVMYYVDPSDIEFSRAGLAFTTVGETPFIGSHIEGNYDTDVSENNLLVGLALFAEYIDGIAVVTIEASGSLGTATATSAAATETTDATKITVTAPTAAPDYHYFIKAQASTAPSAPSYRAVPDSTWKEIVLDENGVADEITGLTSGHKATLIVTNATKQTIAASSAITVVVKA